METKENKNNFSTTVTSHEYQKISYHWQQPIQETRKKTYNKAPHYPCLMRRDHQWPEESPNKGSAVWKHSSCNSSISGPHILKRPITHNSENIWASLDYVSLATILFVQQCIQEKCKNASNFHPTVPVWGESTGDHRNHLRRGQQCEKH